MEKAVVVVGCRTGVNGHCSSCVVLRGVVGVTRF